MGNGKGHKRAGMAQRVGLATGGHVVQMAHVSERKTGFRGEGGFA